MSGETDRRIGLSSRGITNVVDFLVEGVGLPKPVEVTADHGTWSDIYDMGKP